jgi:short-subunit dehydrogenase
VGLSGATVLLTGGSSGIGAATARALAAAGARVLVAGRNAARLRAVAAETGGIAIEADLAAPGGAEALALAALQAAAAWDTDPAAETAGPVSLRTLNATAPRPRAPADGHPSADGHPFVDGLPHTDGHPHTDGRLRAQVAMAIRPPMMAGPPDLAGLPDVAGLPYVAGPHDVTGSPNGTSPPEVGRAPDGTGPPGPPGLLGRPGSPPVPPAPLVPPLPTARGGIDILINNAGIGWAGPLTDMSAPTVAQLVAVNLTAPIELTRLLTPTLAASGRGRVVFISSIAGETGAPQEAVYAATKAGLNYFAECLRYELAGTGVGVSVVVPGVIDTPFFARRGRPYNRRRPVPISAQRVSRTVLAAIEREQPVAFVPRWLRFPAWLHGAAPGTFRALAARFG